ncbi:MAG: long-chain fatty acid--CoA ligase [Phycisphaerae bacterium]|nr:long-chain fatty acid--CoA ligase [Phycisphaerae bacterium]
MADTQSIPREHLGKLDIAPFNDDDPNLAAMLRRQVASHKERTLFRVPEGDVYHDVSWTKYHDDVLGLARGLIELGAAQGSHVALYSENRYEWRVADLGILAAGGVSVPLHAALTGEQARHEIVDSEAKALILSTQDQADKLLPVADELGNVEHVVTFDDVAWAGKQKVVKFADLIQRGSRTSGKIVDEQLQRERAVTRKDLATIIYTSGTTGLPKGVMLTHDNILFLCDRIRATMRFNPDQILLSWLPLSHSFGRMADHFGMLMAGLRVALSESHEAVVKRIGQIQPHWLTAVPRIFEKIFAATSMLPPGEQKKTLKKLFGDRLGWLISGGAPLPGAMSNVYLDAGIMLLEGYGLTETTAITCFNQPERYRCGTVGTPLPGAEVKIGEDGEILIRGRHVMKGYWNMPRDTAETIVDGWLHTGDVGHLDNDGFLLITDRKKDLIVNSAGKNIAPQMVESQLSQVPLIDQVMVIGDGRKFLSALIVPEWRAVDKLFSQMGLEKKPPAKAVRDPVLIGVMQSYIDDALKELASWEQVRKFVLLAEPFTVESGLLTPSMKIRRRKAMEHYQEQLDALYDD